MGSSFSFILSSSSYSNRFRRDCSTRRTSRAQANRTPKRSRAPERNNHDAGCGIDRTFPERGNADWPVDSSRYYKFHLYLCIWSMLITTKRPHFMPNLVN
jgi:hypothetical protein